MTKPTPPTEDQLIAALEEALHKRRNGKDHPGLTSFEMEEKLGVSKAVVNKILHRWKAQGKLRIAKVEKEALDGTMRYHTVYWLGAK